MAKPKIEKSPTISEADLYKIKQMQAIKPIFVTGCYMSPLIQTKSTIVRVTFNEFSPALGTDTPSVAIMMTIEDIQNVYNAMTKLLESMRTMGRIA